jgi:hypothetical protein
MSIQSVTHPVAIKRDGDDWQYNVNGKIEWVAIPFLAADWIVDGSDIPMVGRTSAGLIAMRGAFFAGIAPPAFHIADIPAGFLPLVEEDLTINVSGSTNVGRLITITVGGSMDLLTPGSAVVQGERYHLGGSFYLPSGK